MTAGVWIRTGGVPLARRYRTAVCALHHRVFSTPPLHTTAAGPEEQKSAFDDVVDQSAFAMAVAVRADDLVGFAYGHPLPPDHRWWEQFREPPPATVTREWEGRTFAVIDMAVRESCRRQGVGRALLSGLLATRPEERALLSVAPANEPAHAFYRADGWRAVGRKGPIAGVTPPYWDIYRKELAAPSGGGAV